MKQQWTWQYLPGWNFFVKNFCTMNTDFKKRLFTPRKMSPINFFYSFYSAMCVNMCAPVSLHLSASLAFSLMSPTCRRVRPNPDAATCSKSSATPCATSGLLMSTTLFLASHVARRFTPFYLPLFHQNSCLSRFLFLFFWGGSFFCVFFFFKH